MPRELTFIPSFPHSLYPYICVQLYITIYLPVRHIIPSLYQSHLNPILASIYLDSHLVFIRYTESPIFLIFPLRFLRFSFFSSVSRCTLHTFSFKVLSSCYLLSILLVICCPCLFVVMHLHLAPSPFYSSHTLSFVIISLSPVSLILFFQSFVSWRVMTYT